MNRKLIRPDLTEIKEQLHTPAPPKSPYRSQKKPTPAEQTNAESFYFLKQMTNKTHMVIVLKDGEEITGVIEWYDRAAIKVHRTNEPNILLYKDNIKYMYKANEDKDGEPEEI
jgi:sRNA-binding regulator protein Hfq